MTTDHQQYPVEFEAKLIEEAVMLAESNLHPFKRSRFRRERDKCYLISDVELRETAFNTLHHRWFTEMALDNPLTSAFADHPEIRNGTKGCLVLWSHKKKNEYADLLKEKQNLKPSPKPSHKPSLVIRVQPHTISDSNTFKYFLDRELLYIEDMLDPDFGYTADCPQLDGGSAHNDFLRRRYRTVWDCTIAGRLLRQESLTDVQLKRTQKEFEMCFPELGQETGSRFQRLIEIDQPTHHEILALACEPQTDGTTGICPLCQFPYAELEFQSPRLTESVLKSIHNDFPDWNEAKGICIQCLDLYTVYVLPTGAGN